MKLKDQIPSENIDDNPSGWMSRLKAKLTPDQRYKTDPPDAVRATGNYSDKMTKTSRDDMQRTNHRGKGHYAQRKTNRERKYGAGGGW